MDKLMKEIKHANPCHPICNCGSLIGYKDMDGVRRCLGCKKKL